MAKKTRITPIVTDKSELKTHIEMLKMALTDKNYQVLQVLKFLMSNWATNEELQTKFDLSKRTIAYYISAYRKTDFEVETKSLGKSIVSYHVTI